MVWVWGFLKPGDPALGGGPVSQPFFPPARSQLGCRPISLCEVCQPQAPSCRSPPPPREWLVKGSLHPVRYAFASRPAIPQPMCNSRFADDLIPLLMLVCLQTPCLGISGGEQARRLTWQGCSIGNPLSYTILSVYGRRSLRLWPSLLCGVWLVPLTPVPLLLRLAGWCNSSVEHPGGYPDATPHPALGVGVTGGVG